MKKIFTLFFAVLLGAVCAFSQTETKPAADWKTFAPEREEFTVEIPVALDASIYKNDDENSRYFNAFEGTYFYIFSDSQKKAWQCGFVKGFVKAQGQTGTSENLGDFETEKFAFSDGTYFYHTILIAKSKDRCYAFQTVSPIMDNPSVERFFKSLKLKNQSVGAKTLKSSDENAVNITIKPEEPEIKKNVPPGGRGSGGGTGIGIGSGTGGSGSKPTPGTTPTPSTTPTGTTSGVKILTKPRANYTDAARFYETTGNVLLRVTFSASGTIGAISPINKLPFGLTEQAVAAARGITFEPATRNGTPYSVVKPVQYTFTLF